MSVELTEATLIEVVSGAIKTANKTDTLSAPVTMDSAMGSPREWDSLSFVAVFNAVAQTFGVELEDDDAIEFQSVRSIFALLQEIMEG